MPMPHRTFAQVAKRRLTRTEGRADWVHHDLAASFTNARVWGSWARFNGQRVGRDHAVEDGDVVEILR